MAELPGDFVRWCAAVLDQLADLDTCDPRNSLARLIEEEAHGHPGS